MPPRVTNSQVGSHIRMFAHSYDIKRSTLILIKHRLSLCLIMEWVMRTTRHCGFFGCDLTHVNAPSRQRCKCSRNREANMFSWLMGGLLMAAGALAGLLVGKDSPQFLIMQMAVTMLLFAFIVAALALWPERWSPFVRLRKPR
jgi:hypothetical protein